MFSLALFVALLFTPLSIAQVILIMIPVLLFRSAVRRNREAEQAESYPENDLPFGG